MRFSAAGRWTDRRTAGYIFRWRNGVKHHGSIGGLVGKVFINPNFHVILVHLPLGVFGLGILIELLSFMYRRSTLRLAGRWMILLGALSSIPAAFTGIYALNDIAERSQADGEISDNAPWAQVAAGAQLRDGVSEASMNRTAGEAVTYSRAETAEAWRLFSRHAWVEGVASALVSLMAVFFLGLSDRMRRRFYFPALLLLLCGAGLMSWGAWYAGEGIYRFGSVTRLQKALPDTSPAPTTAPAATVDAIERAGVADSSNDGGSLPLFDFAMPTVDSAEPTTRATSEPSSMPLAVVAATTAPAEESRRALEATAPPSQGSPPITNPTARPTTTPAAVAPPPTVPPANIFPPLAASPPPSPAVAATHTLPPPATPAPGASRVVEENKIEQVGTAAYYLGPPLQIHVLLAGFSVAVALGALGVSLRRLSTMEPVQANEDVEDVSADSDESPMVAPSQGGNGRKSVAVQDLEMIRTLRPGVTVAPLAVEPVPAARFWLLALLCVLLTASAGIYFLAAPASLGGANTTLNTGVLWSAIADKAQNPNGLLTRRLAHVVTAAALLLLPLLLAILAQWSKSRLILGLTSLLLVAVIAAQVWTGILLLYDTNLGKITHFNPAAGVLRHAGSAES